PHCHDSQPSPPVCRVECPADHRRLPSLPTRRSSDLEDLLSATRENDSETLNYAIFLDEPGRVAVIIAQYASSAGWLAHNANLGPDRKSTRLNSSHSQISYAVFCLKKKKERLNSINNP